MAVEGVRADVLEVGRRPRASGYDYLPFGQPLQTAPNSRISQRYGYTSREVNPASPLMYYRYRQYEPGVGRFTARDPVDCGYSYVANSPTAKADPRGLREVHVAAKVREHDGTEGEVLVPFEIPEDCRIGRAHQYPIPAKCSATGKFVGRWTLGARNIRLIQYEPDLFGPAGPVVAFGYFEYRKHEEYEAYNVSILVCLRCTSDPKNRAQAAMHILRCKDKPYYVRDWRYKQASATLLVTGGYDVRPPDPIPW